MTSQERDSDGFAQPARIRPFLESARTCPESVSPDEQPAVEVAAEPPDLPVDVPATPRPFVITAGRVAPADPELSLETQVTAVWNGSIADLPPESQAIVKLCVEPLSVAEISARLGLHLGVTKVLVSDLSAVGHLHVHQLDPDGPNSKTILRVIDGLRALS